MMQQCSFCGNKHLKKTVTEYTYRHDGAYMIFQNVPAVQCEFCGEKYFDSKTLKRIESEFTAVKNGTRQTEEIRVPIEDFSQLDVA